MEREVEQTGEEAQKGRMQVENIAHTTTHTATGENEGKWREGGWGHTHTHTHKYTRTYRGFRRKMGQEKFLCHLYSYTRTRTLSHTHTHSHTHACTHDIKAGRRI